MQDDKFQLSSLTGKEKIKFLIVAQFEEWTELSNSCQQQEWQNVNLPHERLQDNRASPVQFRIR